MPDYLDFSIRFFIFASFHSLLAINHVKKWAQKILGNGYRFYRVGYNVLSLAQVGWVMAAYRNPPVLYFIPGIMSLILYLAQGVIIILIVYCASQTSLTLFLGLDQMKGYSSNPILLSAGCYGKVRHPQYTLAAVFLVTNPVMTTKWLIFSLLSIVYFFIGAILEEKRLIEEFGEEYLTYRNKVPMFIPQLKLR